MDVISICDLVNENDCVSIVIPIFMDLGVPQDVSKLLSEKQLNKVVLEEGKESKISVCHKNKLYNLVFVCMGNSKKITSKKCRELVGGQIKKSNENLYFYVDHLHEVNFERIVYDIVLMSVYSSYSFKKVSNSENNKEVYSYCFVTNNNDYYQNESIVKCMSDAVISGDCINHARDIANTPVNYMTPENVAEYAEKIAKNLNVKYEILTNKELTEKGFGALLGVNRGSSKEARVVTLWYNGAGDSEYTALVGKGITFDGGGYNLKRSAGRNQRFDMCGAANVLGAFELITRLKLKANVIAILVCSENKIGPNGYTCDEVLTSLSGKTIEITNTDAEGRLLLCDGIEYAQQLGANRVIDVATLTGACAHALGLNYTGAFTNDKEFLDEFLSANEKTSEMVWELPIDEYFEKQACISEIADMPNCVVGAEGGASLAAAFLKQFVHENTKWIHLDIAPRGAVHSDLAYASKGASGVMVESLANLMKN